MIQTNGNSFFSFAQNNNQLKKIAGCKFWNIVFE